MTVGKVENYFGGAWVTLDTYLVASDDIPRTTINRDFSIMSARIKIEIAGTIKKVRGSNYEFEAGDLFRFSLGSDWLWGGMVDECVFNYRTQRFEIILVSTLEKLKNVLIQYNSLHAYFASATNWWDYNSNAYSFDAGIVSITWMMKSMFEASGLSLDVSACEETVLFTRTPGAPLGFDPAVAVKYKHLIVVEDMLWCINQGVARSHVQIDDLNFKYNQNKISCWDLMKDLPSYLRLGFKQTDIFSYELNAITSSYSPTDSTKYEYERRRIRAEATNLSISINYAYHDQISEYKSSVETFINNDITIGGGKDSVQFYNNFIIWFTDVENNSPSYYDSALIAAIFSPEIDSNFILRNNTSEANFNPAAMKIREKISSSIEEKIRTEYETDFNNIRSHSVDIQWGKSILTQEEFDV